MLNEWDTEASLLLELPRIQASLLNYDRLTENVFGTPIEPLLPDRYNPIGHFTSIEPLIDFFTDQLGFDDDNPDLWWEDEVTETDFNRTIYQLVYLTQDESFILAMLGFYVPILRSKFLALHHKKFQNRMICALVDDIRGLRDWQGCDLYIQQQGNLFDWREARNDLTSEKIKVYLNFAGLPTLDDPNVPPAWVFRELCSLSVADSYTDEELRASLYSLYEDQDYQQQHSELNIGSYQKNLFEVPEKDHQSAVSEEDIHDLDKLFLRSIEYRQSANYLKLLDFIIKQKKYAPYNAFLMHTQHPGMTHAETAYDWMQKYERDIRPKARPLVILIPFGPVDFVYDIEDTVGPPLPLDLTDPFRASGKLPSKSYDCLHTNCSRLDVTLKIDKLKNNLAGYICKEGGGYAAIPARVIRDNSTKASSQFYLLRNRKL